MTISAVVVSYRPGTWLERCLASLAGQVDEVLVMDNGSPEAEASRLGLAAGARVVRSEVNRGFAPAVNAGAELARGDVLALLNDDAEAGPGWARAACEVLAQPAVAAVGPKIVLAGRYRQVLLEDSEWRAPGDPRPLGRQIRSVTVGGHDVLAEAGGPGLHRTEEAGGVRWRWTAGPRPWYVPLPDEHGTDEDSTDEDGAEVVIDGAPAPPGPVVRLVNSAGAFLDDRGYAGDIGADGADDGRFDHQADRFSVSGCAFVTRMGTWKALGPFAAPYFAYYEDADWCWRAHLAGLRVVYDPSSTVLHRRSASSGGRHEPWVRVMAERNRTLTMVRNGPVGVARRALGQRARGGPDGGVRAGVARLLPWALASRARLSRRWDVSPREVWSTWAGTDAPPPE
jgi:GT2 family glycosyltransferase